MILVRLGRVDGHTPLYREKHNHSSRSIANQTLRFVEGDIYMTSWITGLHGPHWIFFAGSNDFGVARTVLWKLRSLRKPDPESRLTDQIRFIKLIQIAWDGLPLNWPIISWKASSVVIDLDLILPCCGAEILVL